MNKKVLFSLITGILLIGFVISAEAGTSTKAIGELENIGNLVSDDLGVADISAKGVDFSKSEEASTLTFKTGGIVTIRGEIFENVVEGSEMELDSSGKITFADLTTTKETIFNFDGNDYKVPAGKNIKYENGKITCDIIEFKTEGLDSYTKINSLTGNKASLSKDATSGNYIVEGNFKIGSNEFKSLGEGKTGKIVYSKSTGKISEVFEGTEATIDGINNKVSFGKSLKVSYDDSFDLSKCSGNCINYGKDSISLSGAGFTTNLGEKNLPFGYMNTKKEVQGIGTKTREFEVSMNGGNLQISKGENSVFNVNGNGEYIIKNGRTVVYSQKISDKESLLVRTNYGTGDKYGLTYSYDLNINNGEYNLENNVFKDKSGNILVNANTEWENIVLVARDTSLTQASQIRSELQKEGKKIYTDDPNFLTWIKGDGGEAIMKEICLATDTANNNVYGVKISPLEVYTAMKSEAAGFTQDGRRTPLFGKYLENPNWDVIGMEFGLTNCGSNQDVKNLKDSAFISKDLPVKGMNLGSYVTPGLKAKDGFEYFAGVWAQRTYTFEKDFKQIYGEDALKGLTFDEKHYWVTCYFNVGVGCVEKLKDRNNYVPVWQGEVPDDNKLWKYNARQRTDFTYLLKKLGLFNYP